MLLNSLEFMFFFPIVVMLYFLIPPKHRYLWLLGASYYFYACWNPKYTLWLLFSTLTTYFCAKAMRTKKRKMFLFLCIFCNVWILVFFKFSGFFLSNVSSLIQGFQLQNFDILLPIGMSFYVLQSLGYVIDVYKGKIDPETNFLKYALFVSFFLTILSGPIARGDNLLKQIQEGTDFSYDRAKSGLLMMVYGYFEKLLVANRLAVMVDSAYSYYETQNGAALFSAILFYGIQIYVDFSGYSHIVIGAARILGFTLPDNFRQPYFALTIKDFWKRWHISLSSWLRDYVYIPLGGSRGRKVSTYRNLMITFLVSALWHGVGWNYIIWGGLHGIYQVIGNTTLQLRKRLQQKLKFNTNCFSYHLFQMVIIFSLVDFAWIFFRASSTSSALTIIKKVCLDFQLKDLIVYKAYLLGMEEWRFTILLLELLAVLVVDILHERKKGIVTWLNQQNIVFRWSCYLLLIMILFIGVMYDYGVDASTFIYTRF